MFFVTKIAKKTATGRKPSAVVTYCEEEKPAFSRKKPMKYVCICSEEGRGEIAKLWKG